MKKAMKKLMAALLAVAMVCAMAIPAFAAVDITSHTFEAYQIFAGDLNEGTLSNVTWGHNVTTATLLNYLKPPTPLIALALMQKVLLKCSPIILV